MTITAAITWLNTQIAAISGIDVAAIPGDNIGVNGLIAMAYDASGVLTTDDHLQGRDLSNIQIVLIYPRSDLRQAIVATAGKPQAIRDIIARDPSMGGNVQTFGEVQYTSNLPDWMAINNFGYAITITNVKIRPVISP